MLSIHIHNLDTVLEGLLMFTRMKRPMKKEIKQTHSKLNSHIANGTDQQYSTYTRDEANIFQRIAS